MIELKSLQKLLAIKDEELKKLDIEQLRATLGVFRYCVRGLEREINRRCEDNPFGIIKNKNQAVNKSKF
jgi:hypothetical protein